MLSFLRSRWSFLLWGVVTFAANWGLDRFTKVLAVDLLQGRDPLTFFGDLVVLQFAVNTGAFLSLGATWPFPVKATILLGIPLLLCLAALVYAAVREPSLSRSLLIVTVAAGGIGNLGDRLFQGFQVVDFLNFGLGPLRTGVLNVADLSVTFGILLFLVSELRLQKRSKESP